MINIKRPILIITVGYLVGIIYGLYFKKSIVFILLFIYGICYLIYKLRTDGNNRYKLIRYLKVFFKLKTVLIFSISAIISNIYILVLNYRYDEFYKNVPDVIIGEALIIREKIEDEYNYQYIIKMKTGKFKNKKFILNMKKNATNKLNYGNLVKIEGIYIPPTTRRNYKGFDYREYLKTKTIWGTIKAKNMQLIKTEGINKVLFITNNIRNNIIAKAQEILPIRTNKIFIGILLGDKSGISDDTLKDFKSSNLLHILSVSGAHTSYLILGMAYILSKSKINKRYINIIIIIILIIFVFVTNFTVSVIRACLMGILMLSAKVFYRKEDFTTSISLALLITLIFNPFKINDIGLQLSYLGTIGIILFNENITKIFEKIKFNKKISEILSITCSAQVMIMPIIALQQNTISFTFFISNVLAMPFLEIIILLGFGTIFISFISYTLAKILAVILNFALECLINIAHFTAIIPFSQILIKTPNIITIILIYFFIISINYIFTIYYSSRPLRLFQKKLLEIMNLKCLKKVFKIIILITILFIIFLCVNFHIPRDMKIYFIDVGQGDSTLIVTSHSKKILIDGGEGKTDLLLDYLLDRRIKTIDYMIVSHFDIDHVGGLFTIIDKLKVKNVIIGNQFSNSENIQKFLEIQNRRKVKLHIIKSGDRINIEKDLYLDILWPGDNNLINENILNNNSLICKLCYKNFSILFTGDIEKEAEEIICKQYKNIDILSSTILKIAHHGSNTSSTEQSLKLINPRIALIGVGNNNKFGHPNNEVIERLKALNCKIYRTDLNGEIYIKVNTKGHIMIKKFIK